MIPILLIAIPLHAHERSGRNLLLAGRAKAEDFGKARTRPKHRTLFEDTTQKMGARRQLGIVREGTLVVPLRCLIRSNDLAPC
jgi:hypothetical protein